MNKLNNKKAFQDFFENAPEISEPPMPAPQMPEDNPQSNGNGNAGLVISFAVVLIVQFLMIMSINNSQKKILGQMKSFPQPPKTIDDSKSSIEKENPTT
jgi:hypothetical protein